MREGGWVVGLVTVLYVVGLKITNFFGGGDDGQKLVGQKITGTYVRINMVRRHTIISSP